MPRVHYVHPVQHPLREFVIAAAVGLVLVLLVVAVRAAWRRFDRWVDQRYSPSLSERAPVNYR